MNYCVHIFKKKKSFSRKLLMATHQNKRIKSKTEYKNAFSGTFLVIPRLGLCASHVGGTCSIPVQRTNFFCRMAKKL